MKNANKNAVVVTVPATTKKAVAPVKTATAKTAIVVVSPIAPAKEKRTPATMKVELVTICKTKYGCWHY